MSDVNYTPLLWILASQNQVHQISKIEKWSFQTQFYNHFHNFIIILLKIGAANSKLTSFNYLQIHWNITVKIQNFFLTIKKVEITRCLFIRETKFQVTVWEPCRKFDKKFKIYAKICSKIWRRKKKVENHRTCKNSWNYHKNKKNIAIVSKAKIMKFHQFSWSLLIKCK